MEINQPKSIPIEVLYKLGDLAKTHICKINCNNGRIGTGFFFNIPFGFFNTLKVLMTSNQILNSNDIQSGQTINFTLDNDLKFYSIFIDETRKTYTNVSYDFTVIEIKQKDNIDEKSFFDIDKKIFQENANEIFANSQIFLLHYPKGVQIEISTGIIKLIKEDNKTIYHTCDTTNGSSGSPIINRDNLQIIGIHVGAARGSKNYNIGILLKEPIEIFNEEIKIKKSNKDNKNLYNNQNNSIKECKGNLFLEEVNQNNNKNNYIKEGKKNLFFEEVNKNINKINYIKDNKNNLFFEEVNQNKKNNYIKEYKNNLFLE